MDVFGLDDQHLNVADPVLNEGEKSGSSFLEPVFPVLVGQNISEVDLIGLSLNLLVFGLRLDGFL